MPIYEVEVTHTVSGVIWLEADNDEMARAEAMELADPSDWDEADVPDIDLMAHDEVPSHVWRYWSGGEEGDWVYPAEETADA